jgi:hypothetical protein
VSAEDAREGVGRRRILDIPASPGEPGLAAGDGGGLSVVSSGAGTGAARVKFEASTGVGRTGSGCAIAGAGAGGTYILSSGVNSSSSSSSSPSPSSPSSELIPPSSSNSGPVWCERRVPIPSVYSKRVSKRKSSEGDRDVQGEQRRDWVSSA